MADPISRNGWRTYRFDQIATIVNDRIDDPSEAAVDYYVGLEHLDSESLTIRRWGSPSDVEATKLKFRAGDIIFGRRRVYQRKLAVAHFDGICSAHAMVLRARAAVALPGFLPFFMQSDQFMERAKEISVGSLSPTINWKTLAKEKFALPPPEEQKRIAEAMTAFGRSLDAMSELKVAVLRSERALLEQAFDSRAAQEAQLQGPARGGAEWLELGSLAPLQAGYAFPSEEFSLSGDRLLRGSNVGVDRTNWDTKDTRYWPTNRRDEVQSFVLNDGDIVLAMDRPFISEGFKVARITSTDLPALLLQRVGRFVTPENATGELLWAFVHSGSFHLQLLAQQEGTDLPHISKSQIERTLVPKATVQAGHVGPAFSALYEARSNVETRLTALRSLRSAFTRRALE